ncbi:MAG TPA: GGDEF domain-containing protein, partial [Solirubrobacteraceae bacterium]|nr:GGDEF domain-containing protein [Solirubrobacteraceae bacterium]
LVAWNVGALAVLAALVILDDDPRSPVAFAFAGPIAAGALSFPARTVAALTLAGVATCGVSLAAAGATDGAYLTLLLVTLACVGAACAWQARQKQRALDHLAQLSRTDELTGCLNRRGFVEELDARLVRHERYAQPFGLVLLDLDGFKEINDRYGHAAGDDLLRRTTAALCGSLRGSDAVARLGGDEFGVLLDQSDAVAAELVAGRLREQVRRHAAVSAGHAACPDDGAEADTLYRRADGRLYEAKRQPSMSG